MHNATPLHWCHDQDCIAKDIVYKGLQEPRTVGKLWESEEPNTEDKQTSKDSEIAGGVGTGRAMTTVF